MDDRKTRAENALHEARLRGEAIAFGDAWRAVGRSRAPKSAPEPGTSPRRLRVQMGTCPACQGAGGECPRCEGAGQAVVAEFEDGSRTIFDNRRSAAFNLLAVAQMPRVAHFQYLAYGAPMTIYSWDINTPCVPTEAEAFYQVQTHHQAQFVAGVMVYAEAVQARIRAIAEAAG